MQTMPLNEPQQIRRIQQKQYRSKDRTLRNPAK